MKTWIDVLSDESLSHLDVHIYAVVHHEQRGRRSGVELAEADVARLARVHRVTAGNSLRKLRERGYLEAAGDRGTVLVYRVS